MRKRSYTIDCDSMDEFQMMVDLQESQAKTKKIKQEQSPTNDYHDSKSDSTWVMNFDYNDIPVDEYELKKKYLTIMAIGCSQTGKKNNNFMLSETVSEEGQHNYLLDIIVKHNQVDPSTKNIFKFWIHNISKQDYFEQIVDIYYQNSDIFILFFRLTNQQDFINLVKNYSQLQCLKPFILIGMDFEMDTEPIRVSTQQINSFLNTYQQYALGYLQANENDHVSINKIESILSRQDKICLICQNKDSNCCYTHQEILAQSY